MREVIVKEWYDNLDILHQKEIDELVRCGDCIHQFWCSIYQAHKESPDIQEWYCADGERKQINDMGSK